MSANLPPTAKCNRCEKDHEPTCEAELVYCQGCLLLVRPVPLFDASGACIECGSTACDGRRCVDEANADADWYELAKRSEQERLARVFDCGGIK